MATAQFHDIKQLGSLYPGWCTISLSEIPQAKADILADADNTVAMLEKQYIGLITSEEHCRQVIDVWNNATEKVTDADGDGSFQSCLYDGYFWSPISSNPPAGWNACLMADPSGKY